MQGIALNQALALLADTALSLALAGTDCNDNDKCFPGRGHFYFDEVT